MSYQRHSFEALRDYLPEGSFDLVMPLIRTYKVHLTVTRERQTKLGDYRHAWRGKNHRISVNGNLNRYAFLITLLHELAHLLAYEQFGPRIAPHGREWQQVYAALLQSFLDQAVFPSDIAHALTQGLRSPAASSCADDKLLRVLRRYDESRPGIRLVEELSEGDRFITANGRIFVRGKVLRKRIQCLEIPSRRLYLFSPVYEVRLLSSDHPTQ